MAPTPLSHGSLYYSLISKLFCFWLQRIQTEINPYKNIACAIFDYIRCCNGSGGNNRIELTEKKSN